MGSFPSQSRSKKNLSTCADLVTRWVHGKLQRIAGWWFSPPLWKIWVRQWEGLFPTFPNWMESHKINVPNQPDCHAVSVPSVPCFCFLEAIETWIYPSVMDALCHVIWSSGTLPGGDGLITGDFGGSYFFLREKPTRGQGPNGWLWDGGKSE